MLKHLAGSLKTQIDKIDSLFFPCSVSMEIQDHYDKTQLHVSLLG